MKQPFSREIRNGKVVYIPRFHNRRLQKTGPEQSDLAEPLDKRTRGGCLAFILLVGLGTTVAGLIWFCLEFMINPDMAFWSSQFLPQATDSERGKSEQPQTLAQLRQEMQRTGQVPGQPIVLAAALDLDSPFTGSSDVLIPTSSRSCPEPSCLQSITQLQIYRSLQLPFLLRLFQGQRYYRLLDQITVQGPEEVELSLLARNPDVVSGSHHPLPLTRIDRLEPAPKPGVWLNLTGLRSQGSATAAYGQLLYFDPAEAHLSLMLTWLSPTGVTPSWQQVTGEGLPELVVDESVGLEPSFSIYQLQSAANGAQQIRRISIAQPAFSDPLYAQGLGLARGGLWSPALQIMKQVRRQQTRRWSAQAQAQLDFIQLHAWKTQAQAQQAAASPVQKISAYLINGSWNPALAVLQDKQTNREEIKAMLEADTGALKTRVQAALAAQPGQKDAIAWGALLLHTQQSPAAALAWTRQQAQGNPNTLAHIQTLLNQLDKPPLSSAPVPASSPSPQTEPLESTPTPNLAPSSSPTQSPNPAPFLDQLILD